MNRIVIVLGAVLAAWAGVASAQVSVVPATGIEPRFPVSDRAGFMHACDACMACHVAEKIGFINGRAVFKRVAQFPAAPR